MTGGRKNAFGSDQAWRATINLPIVNVVPGDVNLDGEITLGDGILLNRYLLGEVDLNSQQLASAESSDDVVVNLGDLKTK